jgi:hypothetical protein
MSRWIAFKWRIRDELIGYRTVEAEKIIFFTTYNLQLKSGDESITNDYRYLKSLMVCSHVSDEVLFLGQPLVEAGDLDEQSFRRSIEKVRTFFANQKLIYVPHKREQIERVRYIEKEIGLAVRKIDVPIEFQIATGRRRPGMVASFFSSALENCRMIFGPDLNIKYFRIEPDHFLREKDFVRSVYEYFDSIAGEHFERVDL